MRTIQKYGSRAKAKVKGFFESGDEATRPSTPTPSTSLGDPVQPVIDQAHSDLLSVPATSSTLTIPPGPTPHQGHPTVPTAGQTGSHISLAPGGLLPTRPSTPSPNSAQVGTLATEHVPSLPSPDSVRAQVDAAALPVPAHRVDVAPPVVENPSMDPPAAAHKGSGVSGSDTWLWIKSEGWPNLRGLLETLGKVASVSGLGPIKQVAEGFAKRIGVFEEAARDRKEYDEMCKKVDGIFGELRKYCSSSPVISTSVESICGSIQKELDYLGTQLAVPTTGRLLQAETEANSVRECYGRIQDHLQRLARNADLSTWKIVDELATEHRIEKLAPSMWPCYNSEKAVTLERRACTQGTRVDVLAQMQQWIGGQGRGNVYWINGMAGTGKTTIAYSFCQQLDEGADRLLCASFFCSRSLPECRDVGRIIPSIAYQLARRSQPFRYALSLAMEKDPDAHTRSPDLQFNALMIEPLSDPQVRDALPANMVAVIDALDECDDIKSTELILNVMLTKSKGLPVKFVVSSRPEVAIRDQMEKGKRWKRN